MANKMMVKARAKAASNAGGKPQSQLASQKRQSRNERLKTAGEKERGGERKQVRETYMIL
ncbi:hypothetical protein E4U58_003866 [Claviceps cyperi]|nr:hypothetical protein E4U58_003866 [Claviceps cyperi]